MIKLKPGKYVIGDPCYVVKDSLWLEYCELLDKSEAEKKQGLVVLRGVEMFASSTAYGDGVYLDKATGEDFAVDAGLIGATPLDQGIEEEGLDFVALANLGAVKYIGQEFGCIEIENGLIKIENYIIDTDPSNDYYYDDEY